MNNILFKLLGAENPDTLDFKNPTIYSSTSLISSLSYAGNNQTIKKSSTIDKFISEKLSQIDGKFSLGFSNGTFKNAHIYSKDATHLDGICRICYVQQENDDLLVSEYHGNRGAKYSALFNELAIRLNKIGFSAVKGQFKIDKNHLDDFVSIVNSIIEDKINNNLILEPINDIDAITIKGKQYFYYKAYYINKPYAADDIELMIKKIANFSLKSNDIAFLENIDKKIKTTEALIENRITALKSLDLL